LGRGATDPKPEEEDSDDDGGEESGLHGWRLLQECGVGVGAALGRGMHGLCDRVPVATGGENLQAS
jgi:hypothetical protein